jgi:hypothetical protein
VGYQGNPIRVTLHSGISQISKKGKYTQNNSSGLLAASSRVARSIANDVTGATTLLGTVLNAACSGPKRVRLRDEPNSEPSQHPSDLKNEGYILRALPTQRPFV